MIEADFELVREHLARHLDRLRGRTIFITGATGFFGLNLVDALATLDARMGLGLRVFMLVRNLEVARLNLDGALQNPRFSLVQGDVTSFSAPGLRVDYVFHLAGITNPAAFRDRPLEVAEVSVLGTWRVLELARQSGAERLLLASSGAVYGPQPAELTHVPENHPGAPEVLDPSSVYAQAKRMSEHLCRLYQVEYGLGSVIARCFAFVGPHLPLDAHYALSSFVGQALRGGPIVVNDGTPHRSYLYAADLVVWLIRILLDGRVGDAYNVGSEEDLTISDVARVVAKELGEVRVEEMPSTNAGRRYVPSTHKARTELGLAQYTPLPTAVRRMADFHLRRAGTPPASPRS